MGVAKKKSRDPETTKARIMAAAKAEFARKGLGGARVDVIAERAKVQKRMMYHYFGNKETLFRLVLEQAYADFRAAEAALEIEKDEPLQALCRLVAFTWDYYLAHPEFISLVNSENLHRAKYLKQSTNLPAINKSFVQRMETLLHRGAVSGVFRAKLDPIQVLITLSGTGFHYFTNQYTGEIVYGRSLMTDEAKARRLVFNIATILRLVCTPQTLMNSEVS